MTKEGRKEGQKFLQNTENVLIVGTPSRSVARLVFLAELRQCFPVKKSFRRPKKIMLVTWLRERLLFH